VLTHSVRTEARKAKHRHDIEVFNDKGLHAYKVNEAKRFFALGERMRCRLEGRIGTLKTITDLACKTAELY
jgi:hypothetical protein